MIKYIDERVFNLLLRWIVARIQNFIFKKRTETTNLPNMNFIIIQRLNVEKWTRQDKITEMKIRLKHFFLLEKLCAPFHFFVSKFAFYSPIFTESLANCDFCDIQLYAFDHCLLSHIYSNCILCRLFLWTMTHITFFSIYDSTLCEIVSKWKDCANHFTLFNRCVSKEQALNLWCINNCLRGHLLIRKNDEGFHSILVWCT